MIIVRDGRAYELTQEEVYQAYREQELHFDIDDVKSELELIIEDDIDEELYVEAAKRIYANENMLRDVALAKRRNMDRYNMEWSYAVSEAVKDAVCAEMDT